MLQSEAGIFGICYLAGKLGVPHESGDCKQVRCGESNVSYAAIVQVNARRINNVQPHEEPAEPPYYFHSSIGVERPFSFIGEGRAKHFLKGRDVLSFLVAAVAVDPVTRSGILVDARFEIVYVTT